MEKLFASICWMLAVAILISGSTTAHQIRREEDREQWMHPTHNFANYKVGRQNPPVEDATFWKQDAQARLRNKVQTPWIQGKAKNVIFYIGDGMSVPTIAAARIFKGQKVDNLAYGEEAELFMDSFPFTGSSKTFCSDHQVADSACSATAYLCGSKGNDGTIGVTPDVLRKSCEAQANPANHVSSVLAWAQAAGKSTGFVTTTRVTHASPAGTYAHIADREWENDAAITSDGQNSTLCDDIAKQLIMREPGKNINVILGGGRLQFMHGLEADYEYPLLRGLRRDGVNLIDEWKSSKNPSTSQYVTARSQLLEVNTTSTDFLLGLFEASHVRFWDEIDDHDDPSLEEMVEVAIKILSKNPNGFFLFVEGGRIDHASHLDNVHRALRETVEFDKAIQKGDNMTHTEGPDADTLIVVTSDHSHVLTFAGYPERGNPILGFAGLAGDGLPYNTLQYNNGPGPSMYLPNGTRRNITDDNFESINYVVPSPIFMLSETHGGDDVLIFAKGPYAHLLTGTHQQSYIPHVIGYAACIGDGAQSEYCRQTTSTTESGPNSSTQPGPSSSTEAKNDSPRSNLSLPSVFFSFIATIAIFVF